MMRFYLIIISRITVVALVVIGILAPASYVVLNKTSELASHYPTARILLMAGLVTVIGFTLTWLIPTVEQFLNRVLFPGSFDYRGPVVRLATYVTTRVPLAEVVAVSTRALTKLTGANVLMEIVERKVNQKSYRAANSLIIPIADGLRLRFEKKSNGDFWTLWDERLFSWFAGQTSTIINLAQEQRREQLRLTQVKARLAQSTQALRGLNSRLAERDREHALGFDQLAHDLKNPVTVMSFALEERAKDNEEYRAARAEISWMGKFIDHILDLSRAEAGKIKLQQEIVDVISLVDDAVEYVLPFAETQRRRIIWRGPKQADADFFTRGDASLLYKLLQLLLLRTTRLSRDTILVELQTSLDEKFIQIDLTLGPLPSRQTSHLKKLLENIKDARPDHDDRQAGVTGLELHISNWIAQEHGGNLLIPEADEQRTVFRVTVPQIKPS